MPARSAHGNPEWALSPTPAALPVVGRWWSQKEPEEELVWIRSSSHRTWLLQGWAWGDRSHHARGRSGRWRDLREGCGWEWEEACPATCGQSVSSPGSQQTGNWTWSCSGSLLPAYDSRGHES